MGYCMTMYDTTFRIAEDDIPGAVLALKELDRTGSKSGGQYQGGKQTASWFAWVSPRNWADTDDIIEMFDAWRYEAEIRDGYLVIDYFGGEKLGDDRQFFAALAPYAEGYVQFTGEDGYTWRWVVDGNDIKEVTPQWVNE